MLKNGEYVIMSINKAIVTGATGFIGFNLTKELIAQGAEVTALIRPASKRKTVLDGTGATVIECGFEDYGILDTKIRKCEYDALFHTAWEGSSGLARGDENIQISNINATLALIDSAIKLNVHTFVGCGSLAEKEALIDICKDKRIQDQSYFYKSAKTAAHWMTKAKSGKNGIRFFWPTINTYGEGELSPRLINTVIRKIYNGEAPVLSEGKQYYDFVHISDVARALCLIAEKGEDGTNYVIGSGYPSQLRNFLSKTADIANGIMNSNVPLLFGALPGEVISLPLEDFSSDKLVRDTGFQPLVPFDEGVRRTALWIKKSLIS